MKTLILAASVVAATLATAGPAEARGDLATRATRLEPLAMGSAGSDFTLSQREYRLETGKYYRLRVSSFGRREYNLVAPEFWRNSWIRQVSVGKIEIKTGTLEELDFDDAGEVEVFFVPVRTGTFPFRVRGLEERGMTGSFVVESTPSAPHGAGRCSPPWCCFRPPLKRSRGARTPTGLACSASCRISAPRPCRPACRRTRPRRGAASLPWRTPWRGPPPAAWTKPRVSRFCAASLPRCRPTPRPGHDCRRSPSPGCWPKPIASATC